MEPLWLDKRGSYTQKSLQPLYFCSYPMITQARDFKFAGAIVQGCSYLVIVAITQQNFQCIMHAWLSCGRSHLSKTHCKFLGGWGANIQQGVTALPPFSLSVALHGRVCLYRMCYIDPRKFFQLCMNFIDAMLLIPNN